MKFNPKKLSTEIQRIADSLPEIYEVQHTKAKLTGEDIHLSGLNSEGYAKDETEYLLTIPIFIAVNHKRKMAKAYKTDGIKGIINYVNSCYDITILEEI